MLTPLIFAIVLAIVAIGWVWRKKTRAQRLKRYENVLPASPGSPRNPDAADNPDEASTMTEDFGPVVHIEPIAVTASPWHEVQTAIPILSSSSEQQPLPPAQISSDRQIPSESLLAPESPPEEASSIEIESKIEQDQDNDVQLNPNVLQGIEEHSEEETEPPTLYKSESQIEEKNETALQIEPVVFPNAVEVLNESAVEQLIKPSDQPDMIPEIPLTSALETVNESDIQVNTDVESEVVEVFPQKIPGYQPPAPPSQKSKSSSTRERKPKTTFKSDLELGFTVQLVFGARNTIKTVALFADRREGMPNEIEIRGSQGNLFLTALGDDCYEAVPLIDAGNSLLNGVEWRAQSDSQDFRWLLSGRELYVLGHGLHAGFVAMPRLRLNAVHAILARASLREQVLVALGMAGCVEPKIYDETVPGVPTGWVLFGDVIPTRAVLMRDEHDILNILCPLHKIEPLFLGGIRLEKNTWLLGFPPRISFTGEFESDFQVKIDDKLAQLNNDGAYEAPGWDAEGEHRLRFGDRIETFSHRKIEEGWNSWSAHDCEEGEAICGASIFRIDDTGSAQVCVPASNPLLIGARPGEIYIANIRADLRMEAILVSVPFFPVWALPMFPTHADKRTARIVQINSLAPIFPTIKRNRNSKEDRKWEQWIECINDCGRKQMKLECSDESAHALWGSYLLAAKQLWRKSP